MTGKELNKVQSVVKKDSEKTLTGAVKAWCQLFKSGKEINEILRENGIKVDKDVVPALIALAGDKEVVIQLCKDILPHVNDVFCSYREVKREYKDEFDASLNKEMRICDIEKIAIRGTEHKRFGYNSPVKYDENSPFYYDLSITKDCKITKVAIPIKRYTHSLIAKCVTYYLTHPKNKR